MVTVGEIRRKTMTPEKYKNAKNDYFAFYIGRPISYVLTIPFLALGINPNTVSLLSLIPSILGLMFLGYSNNYELEICGGLCFLLWNFMDGIDGNIARYTGKTSNLGVVWDATSGYFAMVLTFCAMGLAAYHRTGDTLLLDAGYFTAIFCLLARLIMHKKMLMFSEKSNELNSKENYSCLKIIVLNITSISGFMQVFMMLTIIFSCEDLFVGIYFFIHFFILVVSMYKLLR